MEAVSSLTQLVPKGLWPGMEHEAACTEKWRAKGRPLSGRSSEVTVVFSQISICQILGTLSLSS